MQLSRLKNRISVRRGSNSRWTRQSLPNYGWERSRPTDKGRLPTGDRKSQSQPSVSQGTGNGTALGV